MRINPAAFGPLFVLVEGEYALEKAPYNDLLFPQLYLRFYDFGLLRKAVIRV